MTFHRICNKCSTTVKHAEQEYLTLPGHMSSHPVFSGVRVTQSLFFCLMFWRSLFALFVHVLLAIVLCVLYCVFFIDLRLLITPLSMFFWPLYCVFSIVLRLLITPL